MPQPYIGLVRLAAGTPTPADVDAARARGINAPPELTEKVSNLPANLPDTDLDGLRDWRDTGDGCIVANTPPVMPLFAVVAVGNANVELSWSAVSDADSYTMWVVFGDAAGSNKSGIPAARWTGPWPTVPGCFQSTPVTCTHVGAIAGVGLDINFYQVRGVCGTTEAAE